MAKKSQKPGNADFVPNREIGKSRKRLEEDLQDAEWDRAKRSANGLDTEDQDWRIANVKEARDGQN